MKVVEDSSGLDIIKQDSIDKLFDNTTLKVLSELEKTQQDFWNVDRNSANFLNITVKSIKAKCALELGTSNGYSGIWIAKALKTTKGHLTTIEFWNNRLDAAVDNFKKCAVNDIITPKLGQAVKILEDMYDDTPKPEFDFVFIDANKSEYIKYFQLIDPLLKVGGVIIADNINSHYKKVEPYVKAITQSANYESQLIPLDTGMLYSIKTN